MQAFRVFLVVTFLIISAYTAIVIANQGLGLLPIFFGDIARMEWPGQFNLDFLGFLTFSGAWIAWRHHFTPAGLGLGVLGLLLGAPFLCVYLFIASLNAQAGMKEILLGKVRASE